MTFSIDDELTWRVTPGSPVRELDGMDWECCAALHNLLVRRGVRRGWVISGKSETEMPRITWSHRHITSPALEIEWSRWSSASLKLFLQAAFEMPHDQSFFYYATGLSWPQGLFIQGHEDEGIMCLYKMTNINVGGHRDGLNFDQETSLAMFRADILDSLITSNGRTVWDPLEVTLSAWLDMIDTGKVVARSPPFRGPWEAKPWELLPYSQHDPQGAVNGFDNLVLAIECLLENPSLHTKDNLDDQAKLLALVAAKFDEPRPPEEFGLISKEVLDSAGVGEGFSEIF